MESRRNPNEKTPARKTAEATRPVAKKPDDASKAKAEGEMEKKPDPKRKPETSIGSESGRSSTARTSETAPAAASRRR